MTEAWQTRGREQYRTAILALLGVVGAVCYASHQGGALPLGILLTGSVAALLCLAGTRVWRSVPLVVLCALSITVVGISVTGLSLATLAMLLLVFERRSSGAEMGRDFNPESPVASLENVLRSMASASALRDLQTADHCERVTVNSVACGTFLGLPAEELARLEWAARLHDVGKVAVPQAILRKPGVLTHEEMQIVQRHSDDGADMLVAAAKELATIAKAVRHHHERWDGTGYPVGLKAEAIPLESRIIAIVDMYEALTSDRPYRGAMCPDDAYREVLVRAGTQFDPDVVAVFDALWKQGRIAMGDRGRQRARVPAGGPLSPIRFGKWQQGVTA